MSDFRKGYRAILNSVVGICRLGEEGGQQKLHIFGTGFIVEKSGWIMTCNHVVTDREEDGPGYFFNNGTKIFLSISNALRVVDVTAHQLFPFQGETVQIDTPELANATHEIVKKAVQDYTPEYPDISLLKIDVSNNLPVVKLSNTKIEVGRPVGILGFSDGLRIPHLPSATLELAPLLQLGSISGIMPSPLFRKPDRFAIDRFTLSGSSGSPVFIDSGDVVGMTMQSRMVTAYLLELDKKKEGIAKTDIPEEKNGCFSFAIPRDCFPKIPPDPEHVTEILRSQAV